MTPAWLPHLQAQFAPDFFASDAESLARFGRDWTKVFEPKPGAVALPRTTNDVSKLLGLCESHRIPIVPSGGRTGLAGGAVACDGELVLSLSRMTRLGAVDRLGQTLRVQAGAVTEAVHAHCAPLALTWPVDFASKGSSTVGGNIATNAGGVRVIRYGLTRHWVLGLEVVLAGGRVLELGGALEKNNTGVDLRQLFIGSEGILGVVTEATLKLARVPGPARVMLFAVPDLGAVLSLFSHVRSSPLTVAAFEFFTRPCLERLLAHRKLRDPFPAPATHYVLVEIEGTGAGAADVEPLVESIFDAKLAEDGVMAQHAAEASELWALREGISEALAATGLPHKNDIALPIAALHAFCDEFYGVFAERYPGWEICLFGHIGDGNLHVNVMKPDALSKDEFFARTHQADAELFALVRKHRGSISAEHGIGLLKREFLGYSRGESEIEIMRALKRALDPHGILNPGKVL